MDKCDLFITRLTNWLVWAVHIYVDSVVFNKEIDLSLDTIIDKNKCDSTGQDTIE